MHEDELARLGHADAKRRIVVSCRQHKEVERRVGTPIGTEGLVAKDLHSEALVVISARKYPAQRLCDDHALADRELRGNHPVQENSGALQGVLPRTAERLLVIAEPFPRAKNPRVVRIAQQHVVGLQPRQCRNLRELGPPHPLVTEAHAVV